MGGFPLMLYLWSMIFNEYILRFRRRVKAKRECLVNLLLGETELPSECSSGIVLVFDRKGYLVRKFPEVEIKSYRGQYKLCCLVEEGVWSFRVLFSPHPLTLSAIYHKEDAERLFGSNPDIQAADTSLMEIRSDFSLCLVEVPGGMSTGE